MSPSTASLAWKALAARGRAWRAAVAASLPRLDPDVVDALHALGIP